MGKERINVVLSGGTLGFWRAGLISIVMAFNALAHLLHFKTITFCYLARSKN
jgi:hypothetical protein